MHFHFHIFDIFVEVSLFEYEQTPFDFDVLCLYRQPVLTFKGEAKQQILLSIQSPIFSMGMILILEMLTTIIKPCVFYRAQ